MPQAAEKLIIAVDVPSVEDAAALVKKIAVPGLIYKIGYQLAPVGGFDLARRLVDDGHKVFLDLKYHDIAATVTKGVASLTDIGADFLTVHGEPHVVAAAVQGRRDNTTLKILAVTVLTSLSEDDIAEAGYAKSLNEIVLQRAAKAVELGADGVIASAQEARKIRDVTPDDFLIITPGVRPPGAAMNDQKRVVTPSAAFDAGASKIVIGRPITEAKDPNGATLAILESIQQSMAQHHR